MAGGCGSGDEGDGSSEEVATSLSVTLDVDGQGGEAARTAQVECPGDEACDTLADVTAADFATVPPTQPCGQIFGGLDTATIEGTFNGEEVKGTFNRSNSCEIERFSTFVPLLQALFPGYKPGSALTQK